MTATHHVIRATVLSDITAERRRQIEHEGWTPEHDDKHPDGELARAAGSYALYGEGHSNPGHPPSTWPWNPRWWKPGPNRRRQLVKAAALLVAEIERLDRASQ